ncbi:hypothetical protein QOZ80_3AG0215300 [Eleusine coracana subsp. coracana]|nr:hypothetical protein QOZ80_3AG0215300 [Eleusine coracana subsp. coracana]
MGAKVESESYMPGYYATTDLNMEANGRWSPYYEEKTSNGQLCDGFATKLTNGYSDFDKEMLRHTMLEHDAIFRQQVYELHRVYKLQRDMMKQYQSKEVYSYPMLTDTSQTNSPSQVPQHGAKRTWQMVAPPAATAYRKAPAVENNDTNQSSIKFLREGSVQSSPNGLPSSDVAPKSKQHTFDLRLPADHYVDDDNMSENKPIDFLGLTSDMKPQNDADLTLVGGEGLGRLSDNSSSSGLQITNNLGGRKVADLNEPNTVIDVDKADGSVSRSLSHTLENLWHQSILRSSTTNLSFNKEYTKSKHADEGTSSNFFDASAKIRQEEKPLINKGKQVGGINFLAPRYSETDPQKYFKVSDGRPVNNNQFVYHGQSSSVGWFARSPFEPYAVNNFARFDHPHHSSMGTLAAPISIPPIDHPSIATPMGPVDPRSSVINNTAFIPRFNGSSAVNSYTSLSAVTQSIGSSTPKPKYANKLDRQYSGFPLDSFSASHSRHHLAVSSDMEHKSTRMFEHSAQQSHGKGIKSFNLNEALSDGQEDGLVEQDGICAGSLQHNKDDTVFGISWIKNKATYADPTVLEKSPKLFGHSFGSATELKNNKDMNEAALTIRNLSDSASTSLQCAIKKDGTSEDIAARSQVICNKTHERLPLSCHKHVPKDGQAADGIIKKNSAPVRNFIDLNDDVPNEDNSEESVVSHECQVASLQNNSKRAFVIDLEMPACEEGFAWSFHQECTHLVTRDAYHKADDLSVTSAIAAAESIIALSMAVAAPAEVPDGMLQWLAGLAISNTDGHAEQVEACISDSSDDELDSFESLTLKLEETKIDEYWNRPLAPTISTDEQAVSTAHLLTKPRRGQQRRRRQKRDFQKDILPGLSSLSRPEIIEDVQLLEGLIQASGGSWESSLTRRGRYGGRTRGRKPRNNVTVVVEEEVPVEISAPPKPPSTGDLEADDKGMFGWGRTTRRCRRTRCPSGNNIAAAS